MNTVNLKKHNTDHKNWADIYATIVEGIGYENIPNMRTSATAFTSALTVPDSFTSGMCYNNTGATGTLAATLPAAEKANGKYIAFFISAAQIVRPTPATGEKIYLFGDGVASKYLNIAGVVGNYAVLYCDGTAWFVMNSSGVVTKEA